MLQAVRFCLLSLFPLLRTDFMDGSLGKIDFFYSESKPVHINLLSSIRHHLVNNINFSVFISWVLHKITYNLSFHNQKSKLILSFFYEVNLWVFCMKKSNRELWPHAKKQIFNLFPWFFILLLQHEVSRG